MPGIPPHGDFAPSTAKPAKESIEVEGFKQPAYNTRSKTPANTGRAKTPAIVRGKAPAAQKARIRKAQPIDLDDDATADDEADIHYQLGGVQPSSQKRPRAPTTAQQALELEERTRFINAQQALVSAQNALARAEQESRTLRATQWNPEQGTYSAKVLSVAARVGIRPAVVSEIANKRFVAINVIRLCHSAGIDHREDTAVVPKLIGGIMHFTAAVAKLSDYRNDVSR